jgi:hypothetical protein
MALGFSVPQLLQAFGIAIESSRQDIKIIREQGLLTELGEFPSQEKLYKDIKERFESLDPEEILPVFIFALLKVIKANNDKVAKDLEPKLTSIANSVEELIKNSPPQKSN